LTFLVLLSIFFKSQLTRSQHAQQSHFQQDAPSEKLRSAGGWMGGSVGQAEALAGINIQSEAERQQLWVQFRHLYPGPPQVLVDAVMDHCAAITLKRLKRGELSLLPQRPQALPCHASASADPKATPHS
jgi:hypothetical protein